MSIALRTLGRTGIEVGEVALGCEGFDGKTPAETCELFSAALAGGMNMIDIYTSNPEVRSNLGEAFSRHPRESFVVEGHLCSAWKDGQYVRTRDIDEVICAFEDLMSRTRLDHLDVGMLHYIDTDDDFDTVFSGPVLRYALAQKAAGRIRHLGMSTHNTSIALRAVESGLIDVILFSVNPAYDMLPPVDDVNALFETGTFAGHAWEIDPRREELYRACERAGVAITVMKCLAGGMLLSAERSPLGVALTPVQAIAYCLSRPAVTAVMLGAHTASELAEDIAYGEASEDARDYASMLAHASAGSMDGRCVYCGHCAPCTVGINVAQVNRFLDLAESQREVPETVREHYAGLAHTADECVACGRCERNCPFGVAIIERMARAARVFG